MPTFSEAFKLDMTQAGLDFVDIELSSDTALFVDPFAISQRQDALSYDCHLTIVAFFQRVVDCMREEHPDEARGMLQYFKEPNETRLGLSSGAPQGAGVGGGQAEEIFAALAASSAVKTGLLSALEECELMIEGIGRDKISDLTTNIIRGHLAQYTQEQCKLWNIPVRDAALSPWFDAKRGIWVSDYLRLPWFANEPILLVPKAFVRSSPSYNHQSYYRHTVLEFLQAEHLNAASSLVRTLKNGTVRVYKKDLEARHPCSKEFLFQFSKDHPELLKKYRAELEVIERRRRGNLVAANDEPTVAEMLAAAIRDTPAGSDHASAYHRLMVGVLEFLFYPTLLYPRKEKEIHDGRKRIDIVMENGAASGVFWRLHHVKKLPCAYVFIECKNYTDDIKNPEIDQLSGRFSTNRGQFGVICCRSFNERALFIKRCQDTIKDGRGLVIPLDDQAVLSLLGHVEAGRRWKIEEEMSTRVEEIWVS
ncbi:hypothetical protein [Sorangium sp. So ce388]|uniref:hypothetical protein n=1 Tax=Sorangium sp. So ce388 TaxID=3133309 RepID=UPI003F5AFA86